MKKIAVFAMSVALPEEKGYTRFRYLSEFLVQHGFEVDLITSSFQHWEKAQRDLAKWENIKLPYNLHFINEPGYKKNIDLRRVRSHSIAAKNVAAFLERHSDYDLMYIQLPPNDVAAVITSFGQAKKIPVIVDVNDLWPEAMRMVLDVPVISDAIFYPLLRDAEKVYGAISGVIGTSDEYRDRPKNNNRDIPSATVYVGSEIAEFDAGVNEYSDEIVKPMDEFWVSYAGNLGTSYDIGTMILASGELLKRGYKNIKMVIMGGGPKKEEFEKLAKSIDCNVEFIGYLPFKKMAAYLSKSDILVNSFVKKAPQSIVTKIGDYLAAGRPMINTCSSPEFRKKVDGDGFGVNVEAEDTAILADAIERLYKDDALRAQMGEKARFIAETQFDRPKAYLKIIDMINLLIGEEK